MNYGKFRGHSGEILWKCGGNSGETRGKFGRNYREISGDCHRDFLKDNRHRLTQMGMTLLKLWQPLHEKCTCFCGKAESVRVEQPEWTWQPRTNINPSLKYHQILEIGENKKSIKWDGWSKLIGANRSNSKLGQVSSSTLQDSSFRATRWETKVQNQIWTFFRGVFCARDKKSWSARVPETQIRKYA